MHIKLKCTCGEIISSADLIPIRIFNGTREEPPEDKWVCPHCGQIDIEMDEVDWEVEDLDSEDDLDS